MMLWLEVSWETAKDQVLIHWKRPEKTKLINLISPQAPLVVNLMHQLKYKWAKETGILPHRPEDEIQIVVMDKPVQRKPPPEDVPMKTHMKEPIRAKQAVVVSTENIKQDEAPAPMPNRDLMVRRGSAQLLAASGRVQQPLAKGTGSKMLRDSSKQELKLLASLEVVNPTKQQGLQEEEVGTAVTMVPKMPAGKKPDPPSSSTKPDPLGNYISPEVKRNRSGSAVKRISAMMKDEGGIVKRSSGQFSFDAGIGGIGPPITIDRRNSSLKPENVANKKE